jgi:SAM-dependent methyltransferase
MSNPPDWYGAHVEEVSARFEALAAADVHGWLTDLLPTAPGALVMDVGAGTGRDAAWLAERRLDVVAVEPSQPMLDFARQFHPSPAIRWISDSLPALAKVTRLGAAFDLILLSGVWMFVAPADRPRAFRKLITLLKPGGRLAMSLRTGPPSVDKGMHPVTTAEVEALARAHGALVERVVDTPDLMGRDGIGWTNIVLRLPDDGTGALPLLRQSSSTTTSPPPTSWPCCAWSAASPMARQDTAARRRMASSPSRWGWRGYTGSACSSRCWWPACHRAQPTSATTGWAS